MDRDGFFRARTGFWAFVLCGGIIVIANWTWVGLHPARAFSVTLVTLIASLVLIGVNINGRPAGVLIDNRNRISLSKFQATAWTVLVVTALVTTAAHNLSILDVQPLNFGIPADLLAAMGISATSFVATPLVLSLKADGTPTQQDVDDLKTDLNMTSEDIRNDGKVFGRNSAQSASWIDMLRGEEVGNAASPDLSKIQQLFISVLLYGVYGTAIVQTLSRSCAKIEKLPDLSDNFVWLLALSHASYIAYKAAPHTSNGGDDGSASGSTPKPVG